MPDIVDIKIDGYEKVVEIKDAKTGLHGFIAIHNTILGPALGGTRFYPYANKDDALKDALRLSRGMTFKSAVISATQTGKGDVVKSYSINGKEINNTLQIPSNVLRNGANNIKITRTNSSEKFRLYSSTAELLSCTSNNTSVQFEFTNPVVSQLIFENAGTNKSFKFTNKKGAELSFSKSAIGNKLMFEIDTEGDFNLEVLDKSVIY